MLIVQQIFSVKLIYAFSFSVDSISDPIAVSTIYRSSTLPTVETTDVSNAA